MHDCSPSRQRVTVDSSQQRLADGLKELLRIEARAVEGLARTEQGLVRCASNDKVVCFLPERDREGNLSNGTQAPVWSTAPAAAGTYMEQGEASLDLCTSCNTHVILEEPCSFQPAHPTTTYYVVRSSRAACVFLHIFNNTQVQ